MIELLAPAGDMEKLKTAILYGADAVYMGGGVFSLRSAADNFSDDLLGEGIEYCHKKGKKAYVTANIIPHNKDMEPLARYAEMVAEMGADGIILSDLGSAAVCRSVAPDLPLHISTQANNVNYASANCWHSLGAKRIVLARELTFEEIREIREKTPPDLELEAFVHGAMCVAYSGRCLLSDYMAGRSANRGECAQPCRWNYHLVEELRPGEYMPVVESDRGTFIFNSKDMCMLGHIPRLVESGISSFKIEGRVKSAYYVASVVKAYRTELDKYMDDPEHYSFDPRSMEEVMKISHREYGSGFYGGESGGQIYGSSSYIREYDVVGLVIGVERGRAVVRQLNKFSIGDELDVLSPAGEGFLQRVSSMQNAEGEEISSAPHATMTVLLDTDRPIEAGSYLRLKRR